MQLCGVQAHWTVQKLADCVKCNLGYITQWWQARWLMEVVAELKSLHQKWIVDFVTGGPFVWIRTVACLFYTSAWIWVYVLWTWTQEAALVLYCQNISYLLSSQQWSLPIRGLGMVHNDGVLQVHHGSSSNRKQNEQEAIHKVAIRGNRNQNTEGQTKNGMLDICIPWINQRLHGFPIAYIMEWPMPGYGIEQTSS